jgi:limonene 1,2-monooxygenase
LPVPELLMCKAAALTTQIRMGAAVKLIHLAHPVDTAIQAAVTDHVIGGGRFIFGFGSGFPNPLFAHERGLSHEDRHPRLREALDLISSAGPLRSRSTGTANTGAARASSRRRARSTAPHMPMATATDTEAMIDLAGSRGYTLLAAQLEPARADQEEGGPLRTRRAGSRPEQAAANITVARYVYLADSRREAMDDLRPAITYELGFQIKRGLIRILKSSYGLQISGDDVSFDQLAEAGTYFLGEPDAVARELRQFYEAAGGFGTLCWSPARTGPRARSGSARSSCSWSRWRRSSVGSSQCASPISSPPDQTRSDRRHLHFGSGAIAPSARTVSRSRPFVLARNMLMGA